MSKSIEMRLPRHHRRPTLALAVGLGAATLSASAVRSAHAATTIVVQRGTEAPATLYADGDKLRMDMPAGAAGPKGHGPGPGKGPLHEHDRPSAIIIDAAAKKIDMVQDAEKSYTEVTEEDIKRMQAQVAAAKAQFAERLKNMPPEKRAQMEAMMNMAQGKSGPPKFEFQPLGQKKTINGFSCEMYKVLMNGVPHEEDCISPWSAGVVKQSDFAGLTKFSHDMLSDLGPRAGGIPLFDQYPGMPISRVPFEPGGKKGLESQVKSIKNGPVAGALFVVPAGYTKKALPMGHGPGSGPAGGGMGPGMEHGHGASPAPAAPPSTPPSPAKP